MNRSRLTAAVCTVAAVLAVAVATTQAQLFPAAETTSVAHSAPTCSDHLNQKAAQEAADTRDADGDGIYSVSTRGSGALGVWLAGARSACQQRVISTTSEPVSSPMRLCP